MVPPLDTQGATLVSQGAEAEAVDHGVHGRFRLMAAVWVRWRTELHRQWRSWLAVACLVGLAGGVVTGLAAGARRTESAYPRFLARSRPADVVLLNQIDASLQPTIDLDAAARLPGVAAAVEVRQYFVLGGTIGDRQLGVFPVAVLAAPRGTLGHRLERSRLLEGRRPDPDRPHELLVSYEAAHRFDLGPGSTIEVQFMDDDKLLAVFAEFLPGLEDRLSGRSDVVVDPAAAADSRSFRFRVVGVGAAPSDFPPLSGTLPPVVYATPAFTEVRGHDLFSAGNLFVRLESRAGVDAYKADLERQNSQAVLAYAASGREHEAATQRLIDIQARALWLVAGLVTATAALILVQTLLRQVWFSADDQPILRVLGMSRGQLWLVGALRAALIATIAAGVVVAAALALSPHFPIGLASAAEPTPGFDVDVPAITIGAAVTAFLTLGVSLLAQARRVFGSRDSSGRPVIHRTGPLTRWGSLPFRLGTRMALDAGHGRTAVPVRSTLVALTVGVVAATSTVTIVASLDHLVDTPALYGWQWDAQIGGFATPDISGPLSEGLLDNPAVESLAVGSLAQLEVEGVRVEGFAVDDLKGSVSAAVLEGRGPRQADEIVLGTVTLDAVGADVGDVVQVSVGRETAPMRVVGRAVFPSIGDAGQLGRGARLTYAGLAHVAVGVPRTVALIDIEDGQDERRELAAIRRALGQYPVYEDRPPDDFVNLGESNALPAIAVAAVALVAVATLIHTLATSIRRRRRDLAVLKAMGLGRRRLAATVRWQATVLAAVAVVIGIPLGVAAGRWAWILISREFGFPTVPVVPRGAITVVAVSVLTLAVLVALLPAWIAGRTRVVAALGAE